MARLCNFSTRDLVAHAVSLATCKLARMILTYRYRLLPTKRQHCALEAILESQRQLYNAALEERIEAYRKASLTRTYVDQCKALTEWRQADSDGAMLPVRLQRWTLKRLDEAYRAFFRRVKTGSRPGFPRFRGKGRFDTFGFRGFSGIRLQGRRICSNGLPGGLRVHLHRQIPDAARIRSCVFHRRSNGWTIGLAIDLPEGAPRDSGRVVGIDLGISTFAALSDGVSSRA